MRLIDSTIRRCAPGFGVGRRWLKEHLAERRVQTYLTEGCLQELVHDADAAAWKRLSVEGAGGRYLDCLREEIAARAEFIHRWTTSDEPMDTLDEGVATLVRIARNYALPRPWKVSEPVAAQCARRTPSYWRWASGGAASGGAGVHLDTGIGVGLDAGLSAGAA